MAIRVCYTIHNSQIGGGERVLLSLLRYIDRQRFEPVVLCPGDPLSQRVKDLGCQVIQFSFPLLGTGGKRRMLQLLNPANLVRVARVLKSCSPDIVHTSSYSSMFLTGIAARLLRVPCISTFHPYLHQMSGVYGALAWLGHNRITGVSE